MANPLDMVTQDQSDDTELSSLARAISIRPVNDIPDAAPSADNPLVQAVSPGPHWTMDDLLKGLSAVKDYVAGNAKGVNAMAGRFAQYDRRFTQDVLNLPQTIFNNPSKADEVGQRFLGGENWAARTAKSGGTLAGDALSGVEPMFDPDTGHVSDRVIERAQDLAGLAGGSALAERPGVATLGSGPVRPGGMDKGWFFNSKNGKLHEIDKSDLGPHGDHDGWISLGDNAHAVGVDPVDAGAFQAATYGAPKDSPNPAIQKFIKDHPEYADSTYHSGGEFDNYEGFSPQYEKDFTKAFGKTPEDAMAWRPGHLTRVRAWPDGTLSVTNAHGTRPSKIVDGLLKDNPDLMKAVDKVVVETPDGGITKLTPDQFLEGKWHHKDATFRSDTSKPGAAIAAVAGSGPAPVFYSALEHATTNAAQDVMSPQQWLGYLKNQPGVKAEELGWTGLPDWLGKQKGKVKKEDVQAYLDEHKVELKDVTKTDHEGRWTQDDSARLDELEQRRNDLSHEEETEFQRLVDRENGESEPGGTPNITKYSSYQLPGGDNYREHLLTLPISKTAQKLKAEAEDRLSDPNRDLRTREYEDLTRQSQPDQYKSSHWDEPNVLAHVRTNDRTMPRELTPEHVAANEARAKVQKQVDAVRVEQGNLARSIGAATEPLERVRQTQIRDDIKAGKMSVGDGRRAMEEVVDYSRQLPKVKELQDKLQELRTKETVLTDSMEAIVPKVLTDEQALAKAKDWVNEGNPDSQKWDKTPPERQQAWVAQMHKVAGRRAMTEAEKPVKSLHIEEIQSDWHQQGRKQGYKGQNSIEGWSVRKNEDGSRQVLDKAGNEYGPPTKHPASTSDEQLIKDYQRVYMPQGVGVPDAPFKTTWPELALKRMIRHAAENDYDRISWTPGEAQAARYDLSKQIDKLFYKPEDGYLKGFKDDKPVVHKMGVSPEELPSVVGKEAAQKLLDTKPEIHKFYERYDSSNQPSLVHALEGEDLKVGGEGMREFYDKMLPKMVEKIGKAHGVKVKTAQLPGSVEVRTPKQVYDIMTEKDPKLKEQFPTIKDYVDYWNDLNSEHRADLISTAQLHATSPVHYFDLPQSLKDHAMHKGFPLYMSGIPFPLTPVDRDPFKKEK